LEEWYIAPSHSMPKEEALESSGITSVPAAPEQLWFWNADLVRKEMLSVADNRPSKTQTLRAVERLVADTLPPRWSFRSLREATKGRQRTDARWSLKAPDGATAVFVVGIKRALLGTQLDQVLAQLRELDGLPLVTAPFLSPTLRATLAARDVSYADSTGNLRIVADTPGLVLERAGAAKDPWPSDETLRSLRGRGAGRAIRALVDFRPPYGVRDLADRAAVSLGTLSRVLDLLDREGLVTRKPNGPIASINWDGAIRRWAQDYDFARSNQVATFLEPRGLEAFASKLVELKSSYAVTGAYAAQRFAPIAPARQIAVYVDDIARTAERLRLRPAEAAANVVLAEPYDPVVFDRTIIRDGLRVVSASQLVVDLLTGPGREPSEGIELLAWMAKNEDAWRA
jgi:hypothetical protein